VLNEKLKQKTLKACPGPESAKEGRVWKLLKSGLGMQGISGIKTLAFWGDEGLLGVEASFNKTAEGYIWLKS